MFFLCIIQWNFSNQTNKETKTFSANVLMLLVFWMYIMNGYDRMAVRFTITYAISAYYY